MNGRRLLILCYFYPPLAGGGVHRVLGFTRHLPAFGWSCSVICAGEEDYWVTDATLLDAVPAGTEVIRVPGGSGLSTWLRMRGGGGGEGRRSGRSFGMMRALSDWWLLPDSYLGWARRAAAVARRRLSQGDVQAILSSSPPDSVHLAARAAAGGTPWVADFRDPWVGLHFRKPPSAWHAKRQAALERGVLQRADLVLAASRTHAERMIGSGEPWGSRVRHLPNGFEPDLVPDTAPASDADHFTIAFTGTLSQMPDTETFLEALHDLLAHRAEARRRVRARLIGPFEVGYQDRAIALGLSGIVEFAGPRSHGETRSLQRRADLLVLWKPRGEGYRTMVPGKLYEYLDSARPTIALLPADEEAADLVRRGGGVVLRPGDREALRAELERRYLDWKEHGRAPDARPAWLDGHTRAALAGRLSEQLEGVVAGSAACS